MTLFRQPLFNPRLVAKRCLTATTPALHKQILHDWAQTIRDGSITRKSNKEVAIRSAFIQKFFIEMLGYVPFGCGSTQTISEEHHTGTGSADAALGYFGANETRVLAPVELKGADTPNLDAIMPGRHKSPVQQAWEYAADIPGRKFIVLSNMLEIRLYAYAHTRQVYESFNILELANSDAEYQRFRLLLGADNLLGGQTEKLLLESAEAEKSITRQLYSDYRDSRIQLILALAQHNDLPLPEIITHAQTLLDRILFIAFAEDRELLPAKTIASAYRQSNPYAPQPIWENFKGLFRAVDKGNAQLGIPAYNGGLFRLDAAMDTLVVPDNACELFKKLGEYDFASEVGVTVLGHIFEQSISDLEQLRELTDLDAFRLKAHEIRATASGVSGKRKEHGIVYTPDDITAFIVEQTLGAYLNTRREQLRTSYLESGAYRKPTPAEKKQAGKVREAARLSEFLFWHHWREELTTIKVVDPACGSGAFLIAAFDLLDAEYRQVNEQMQAITGTADLFDINREILNGNLYGVDLNPESIEISKLSLWLKTAQHGKPLQTLEANLRVGNSLISKENNGDSLDARAFDWQATFPDVFAAPVCRDEYGTGRGGFDVVLGNPPYVRQERFTDLKPYFQQHYAVYHGVADLYCYFFELGVKLLKPGGRLGYISSSTFFKTGSGEPLRRYLLEQTQLRSVVDFGDLQVFEGVTTYPAIVVLEKSTHSVIPAQAGIQTIEKPRSEQNLDVVPLRGESSNNWIPACVGMTGSLSYLNLKTLPADGLSVAFLQQAKTMQQSRLGSGSWQMESGARGQLRDKLTHGHPTLKQVYGSPLYGIKTGFNEAFVIDRATRDALIAEDPKSADLLKPFLEGKDLKKWRAETQDLWLILCPKGWTRQQSGLSDEAQAQVWMQTHYPALMRRFVPFEIAARKRSDKGEFWWELRACAYYEAFEKPKIIYTRFMAEPLFYLDTDRYYLNNALNIFPDASYFELGVLISSVIWFFIRSTASLMSGGFFQVHGHVLEKCPIPAASDSQRAEIAHLAETCQRAAEARRDTQAAFRNRIADLAPTKGIKLNSKLNNWWELDFAAFRAEIKKLYKQDIALSERNEWERYFNSQRAIVAEHSAQIAQHEAALNRVVYTLFNLTADEIALIENGGEG